MQSPSHIPFHEPYIENNSNEYNYETLYQKEKDKNSILLARLSEKENLILQLHQANNEAYSSIHYFESKLKSLQKENDEKESILIQRESELLSLKKQMNKVPEAGYIKENGGSLSIESNISMKESGTGNRNSLDLDYKRLKYNTLGNDRRDLDLLYGNLKENDTEKMRHDLKVYEKFYESLAKAVVDCSPPDTYRFKPPNLKQIWKWIRNLIEEYMVIKTTIKE